MKRSDEDTFCIYCQKDKHTLAKLKRHLRRVHPGTYADLSFNGSEGEE